MGCVVELLSIGNELLIGRIANTNAQWLSRRVTGLGGEVKRIHVVGDNLDDISAVIKNILSRKPSIIVTTGGLGPTFDDMTLEAIAKALEVPLIVNITALKMVKGKYRQYETIVEKKIEITPARVKMATLPEGAQPLENPVGTAPGILVVKGKSKIIALPGVPKEMEAIFEGSVEPLIKEVVGNVFVSERTMEVVGILESALAPLIDEVMFANPYVYVKSHPKGEEARFGIQLHLRTAAESREVGEERIKATAEKLTRHILKHGGKVS